MINNTTTTLANSVQKVLLANIDNFIDDLDQVNKADAKSSKYNDMKTVHDHHAMHHHVNHDHSSHSSHSSSMSSNSHAMKMWFHDGFQEIVLFEFWHINSLQGLIASCIVILIMGFLYEGIKCYRVHLQMTREANFTYASINPPDQRQMLVENGDANQNDSHAMQLTEISKTKCKNPPKVNENSDSLFSRVRILLAVLYTVQITVGYFLMLITMTFNSWLTAAVVIGAGLGHWVFAGIKSQNPHAHRMDTFAADACH